MAVPQASLWLMVIGGLLYTIGTYFNHNHQMRYAMAIWHGFVLSGSSLFFAAIAIALAAS